MMTRRYKVRRFLLNIVALLLLLCGFVCMFAFPEWMTGWEIAGLKVLMVVFFAASVNVKSEAHRHDLDDFQFPKN